MAGSSKITDLKNLSSSELQEFISSFGKEKYRTLQMLRWLYQKGASSFEEMTNLPRRFREDLGDVSRISDLTPLEEQRSEDGTRKFLFALEDGERIETVLIPNKTRRTLCVSTQVGCAMGCRFCLTGKRGWVRNLSVSEILNQILAVRRTLDNITPPISNVVLMGMGEPLANYDSTMKAISLMTDRDALKFSGRKVTLSTVGLVPELRRLSKEKITFHLAVSLNASDEETRNLLMPINHRYSLKSLLDACRHFPLKPKARITFEYVLLDGINDSVQAARQLLRILKGIPSKVNLIPLNEAPGIPFKRPPEEQVLLFQEVLMEGRLMAIVRQSKGSDVSAACGQLTGGSPFS
jgi:23S rRNA (adenine2503-C2)-methyltransferase